MTPHDVSVIIPTLNEASNLAAAVESAKQAGAGEVIVSDGGSSDATLEIARVAGVDKLVRSFPGRGTQLASGLRVADRDVVLLLHADNRLGLDALNQICQCGDFLWGAFEQRIDSSRAIYRWVERGNNARVRYRSVAFGDQAIFANRSLLKKYGGIAEVPLMEDVELSTRLRKIDKPRLLPGPVTISDRRWRQNGVVRQTLHNWSLQVRFALGASPETLAKSYRS
ncbi:TIGR04283 family arsenosugar biosynthesis glycosyltransferase [Rubripirellula amarantea]|nr:TIGR04283 family arsenosugar biosynthesis glycosyltransferase [Rubripirellula amarantea]